MESYLIGYDLRKPGMDYEKLFNAIKSLASNWWHCLDSTWIIKHTGTTNAIRDALTPHIDENDLLVVVRLSGGGRMARVQ